MGSLSPVAIAKFYLILLTACWPHICLFQRHLAQLCLLSGVSLPPAKYRCFHMARFIWLLQTVTRERVWLMVVYILCLCRANPPCLINLRLCFFESEISLKPFTKFGVVWFWLFLRNILTENMRFWGQNILKIWPPCKLSVFLPVREPQIRPIFSCFQRSIQL